MSDPATDIYNRDQAQWAKDRAEVLRVLRRVAALEADLAEARGIVEDLLAAVYAWSDGRDGRYPAKEAADAWLAARGGRR